MKSRFLVAAATVTFITLSAFFSAAQAAEGDIPKFVLIQLTRDQASATCSSEVFTQCMGFTEEKCVALSEEAIKMCLDPLPAEINPQTLANSTLEDCPQEIYKKEGFTEEKAKMCFSEALESTEKK